MRRLAAMLFTIAWSCVTPALTLAQDSAAVHAPDVALTPMIAGLLPSSPEVEAGWPISGAWMFPVGDSMDFEHPSGTEPGYKINRGVAPGGADGDRHDGADIANGRAGGRVRAAGCGVIVSVADRSRGGYGSRVVLAHRLADGSLAYTIYAHLKLGSARGIRGASIAAGEALGRVGQTGRATTPHLHFEVRVPQDSTLRWEKCRIVDPIAFVRQRLPDAAPDSGWAAPYLAWAIYSALVPPGADAGTALTASLFRDVLERAGVARDTTAKRSDSPAGGVFDPQAALDWNAVAAGLAALRVHPGRLPPCPVGAQRLSDTCHRRLGIRRPAHALRRLAGREDTPTLGELCLALADFAKRPARRGR